MSGTMNSTQKRNKIKKIVSSWQKFARLKKASRYSNIGHEQEGIAAVDSHKLPNEDTFVVYVGKERRRYELGEHYLKMPLFRSLVERSQGTLEEGLTVPCEVVMFEHLLWMLENNSSALQHAESVDELVEFYAY